MDKRSSDFKNYLQEELVLRCHRNPSYSLRSFARSLDLSPSFLSKVLNGKRRITPQVFEKISTHLDLDFKTIESFKEKNTSSDERGLNHLQLEYFKMISDWYHYAIIELTNCSGFQNSPEWISSKLGIAPNQAKAAVDRLLVLGLLVMKNRKLKPSNSGNTTTKNDFTDFAFKKMQDDLLKKALHSLWSEDLKKRDHTSICMAITPEDIPEIKKRLTQVRREICQYLERPQKKKKTQVYNLNLSFFSLSKETL